MISTTLLLKEQCWINHPIKTKQDLTDSIELIVSIYIIYIVLCYIYIIYIVLHIYLSGRSLSALGSYTQYPTYAWNESGETV